MMFYAVPYVMALLVYLVLSPLMTFLAGIILQLIVAACLADYMDYIRKIALQNMTDQREHKRNFRTYFRTAFILFMLVWFVDYAFQLVLTPILSLIAPFLLIIPFTLLIYAALLLTPYFEALYIGDEEIGSAFSEVKRFMKLNAWVWVANAVFLIGAMLLLNTGLSQVLLLIPMPVAIRPFVSLLFLGAVYQFLLGFILLYRSHLYDVLNKGSRQSRVMRLLNKTIPPKAS